MPKAIQTKAHIISQTASVFNQKGFAGTTLSDMEKATGLTKGSIYNNFANKDEVALAVFDYNLNKIKAVISSEIRHDSSPKKQLLAFVRAYANNFGKNSFPVGGCPILNTAVESDDTHPALRKKASEALVELKNEIAALIRKGIRQNEFRRNLRASDSALVIVATIEGGVMVSKLTGNKNHFKTIIKAVEKIILGFE